MENSIESKTSTEVATAQTFTQADIPSLLATVNAKIKELSKRDNTELVIVAALPAFGRIDSIKDVMTLLQACSSVEGKYESYLKIAAKYLPAGTKAPVFKIQGHTAKEWLDFIQLRINEVTHSKELAKLTAVKLTLESNLSQEMKLANDLKKINEILNEE